MAAVNRVGGLAAGIANAIFVRFYQYVVDPAEADTWPFRLFAYLAKGVLRSDHMPARWSGTNITLTTPPIRQTSHTSCLMLMFAHASRMLGGCREGRSASACSSYGVWAQAGSPLELSAALVQGEYAGILCNLWGLHTPPDFCEGQPQVLIPPVRARGLIQRE